MRTAAELLRLRIETIARILMMEQGKPLSEPKSEILKVVDLTDWFAEEARRTYGRVIPPRSEDVYQRVIKQYVVQ
ncbi:MAG: aldehyde dehydrogenase family protein [Bryobacteraceae bacterium]